MNPPTFESMTARLAPTEADIEKHDASIISHLGTAQTLFATPMHRDDERVAKQHCEKAIELAALRDRAIAARN